MKLFEKLREAEAKATEGPWNYHIGFNRFESDPGCYGAYLELPDRNCLVSALGPNNYYFIALSRSQIRDVLKCLDLAVEALKQLEIKIDWNADDLVRKEFKEIEGIIDSTFEQIKVIGGDDEG